MIQLHDPAVRDSIRARVEAFSQNTPRRWGLMSSDQMLWHCNQALKTSLRDIEVVPRRPPFPVAIVKLILFHLPWPHGAPTTPEFKAKAPHDFEAEREHCLQLIDRFVARKIEEGGWGRAAFGELTGREWSCLHARHLDYHLKQFSA